ncbi:universal stress protein [Natronomonas moolapensis]|uniref:universal stress protein n=1 Tax=Natronomonas moolapensis TaxID=416273 RepID=UPI000A048597|nr:universal stress protein [Natronomonas moolapensis]
MPGIDFEKRRKNALGTYRRVSEREGSDVETRVVRGTPQRRINGIAGTVAADLMLVGSRGHSRLRRLCWEASPSGSSRRRTRTSC